MTLEIAVVQRLNKHSSIIEKSVARLLEYGKTIEEINSSLNVHDQALAEAKSHVYEVETAILTLSKRQNEAKTELNTALKQVENVGNQSLNELSKRLLEHVNAQFAAHEAKRLQLAQSLSAFEDTSQDIRSHLSAVRGELLAVRKVAEERVELAASATQLILENPKTFSQAEVATMLADSFKGNWKKDISFSRGDTFTFRGGFFLVLKPCRGVLPNVKVQTGSDPLYSCLAAPGAPGQNTTTSSDSNPTFVRSAFSAGTGLVVPSNSGAASGSTYQKRFISRASATSLRVHFSGFMQDGNGHEVVFANSYTVKAALILPGGTVVPIYFSGSRSGTVNPGQILDSDIIPASLSVGDVYYIRCMPTGSTVPNNCFVSPTSWNFNEFYQTSDTVDSGTMLASVVLVNAFTPCAITGMVNYSDHNSVLILGDSIAAGYEDYNKGSLTSAPNSGFIGRSVAQSRGYIQGGLSSDRAQYAAALILSGRLELAKYCRYAIVAYGSNDINGGRTVAQFEADIVTLVSRLKALGIKKVAGCTIIPRTTSTDGWMTLANQTNSFGANDPSRIAANSWMLSGTSPFDVVYDTRSAVADTGDSYGLWLAGVGTTTTTIAASPTSTAFRAYLNLTVTANQFESQVVGFSSGAQAGTYRNILKTIVANNSVDPDANFGGIPATSDGVVIYDNYAGTGVHPTTRAVEAMAAFVNVSLLN